MDAPKVRNAVEACVTNFKFVFTPLTKAMMLFSAAERICAVVSRPERKEVEDIMKFSRMPYSMARWMGLL
jgi:hypothetical protein